MTTIGAKVRLHDVYGDDLGTAHVPWPVEIGDPIATETDEYRVVDVIETGQEAPIAALCKVARRTRPAFRVINL